MHLNDLAGWIDAATSKALPSREQPLYMRNYHPPVAIVCYRSSQFIAKRYSASEVIYAMQPSGVKTRAALCLARR